MGEFETNSYFPTPASAMAILNFLEIESQALQENIRTNAIENLDEEDEEDEEVD